MKKLLHILIFNLILYIVNVIIFGSWNLSNIPDFNKGVWFALAVYTTITKVLLK